MYQNLRKNNSQNNWQRPTQPKRGKAGKGSAWGAHRPLQMPGDVQAKMQSSFGYDFSNVRMSENAGVTQLSNKAITAGSHVMFAPGAFRPETMAGQELIGHELSHVVSQSRGEVSAPGGDSVVVDKSLESRADSEGSRAAAYSGQTQTSGLKSVSSNGGGGAAIQGWDLDVDALNVAHYGSGQGAGSRSAALAATKNMASSAADRTTSGLSTTEMIQMKIPASESALAHNESHKRIDDVNKTIGLEPDMFGAGSLGHVRNILNEKIVKKSQSLGSKDEDIMNDRMSSARKEANAWIRWLVNTSRITALMMPEMSAEQCRRDRRLDEKVDIIDKNAVDDGTSASVAEETDAMSHQIDSGMGDDMGTGNKMWTQESHRSNTLKNLGTQYQKWTPALIHAHDYMVNDTLTYSEGVKAGKALVETAVSEAVRKKGLFKKRAAAEAEGRQAGETIVEQTRRWTGGEASARFWRLTSLMGLDFFRAQGKKVLFSRADNQEDFDIGSSAVPNADQRARRVITDSEWGHVNRMGYLGGNSSIQQMRPGDRLMDRSRGMGVPQRGARSSNLQIGRRGPHPAATGGGAGGATSYLGFLQKQIGAAANGTV